MTKKEPPFVVTSYNFLPKTFLEPLPGTVQVEEHGYDGQILSVTRNVPTDGEKASSSSGARKKKAAESLRRTDQAKLSLDNCFDCVFIWDSEQSCYVLERATNVLFNDMNTSSISATPAQRSAESEAKTTDKTIRKVTKIDSVPIDNKPPPRTLILPTVSSRPPPPPRPGPISLFPKPVQVVSAPLAPSKFMLPTALSNLNPNGRSALNHSLSDDPYSSSSESDVESEEEDESLHPALMQTPLRREPVEQPVPVVVPPPSFEASSSSDSMSESSGTDSDQDVDVV